MTIQRFIERLIWWCLLPLILAGGLLVVAQLVTLDQRRSLLAESLLRHATRAVDHLLELKLANLELLAQVIDDVTLHRGHLDLNEALHAALRYQALNGTHVILANGQREMLLHTRHPDRRSLPAVPIPAGRSALDLALVNGRPEVGDLVLGPVSDTLLTALAVPLPRHGTQQPLVLLSTLEARELQAHLDSIRLPPRWRLTVRDSVGRAIARIGAVQGDEDAPDTTPRGFRRHVAISVHAPWTVELQAAEPWPGHGGVRDALLLVGLLLGSVGVAYIGGRIASRRLTTALSSLVDGQADPPPSRDIDEIARVRERLLRLRLEREAAQAQERRRIGLELHDDLQQTLGVLRNDLSLLRRQLPEGSGPARRTSRRATGLVDEAIDSTRRLIADLRPKALDQQGFVPGLSALLSRLAAGTGLAVDLHVEGPTPEPPLPPELSTALYRIAQEALHNIRKHAKATTVHLHLDLRSNTEVCLEISDDGQGFEPEHPSHQLGQGLLGMRERAEALGGRLTLHSRAGDGTAITVHIPLAPPPEHVEPTNGTEPGH